jgi:hypothetical protein
MKVQEWLIVRRVFLTWSISVPPGFEESFERQRYWHARDAGRRVSLTSMVVADESTGAPGLIDTVIADMPLEGDPIPDLPEGLPGRATVQRTRVDGLGRTTLLQGVVGVPGRFLLATITSNDLEWAMQTWTSIRYVPPSQAERHHATVTRAGRRPW